MTSIIFTKCSSCNRRSQTLPYLDNLGMYLYKMHGTGFLHYDVIRRPWKLNSQQRSFKDHTLGLKNRRGKAFALHVAISVNSGSIVGTTYGSLSTARGHS